MGSCNVPQNEIGGKELLLKKCIDGVVATQTGVNATTITASLAHGLKVGDVVKFKEVGANTAFNITDFYIVSAVPTTTTFKLKATMTGTDIAADAVEAALDVDFYRSVGGLRSKSFSFSSEGIDITNQESEEWKVMLDGAGIRSFSVSGSGVYTNEEVFQALFTAARTNALTCLMFIDVRKYTIFAGCFKITSLEVSGDYDAESNYSISAESSGQIDIQTLE